MLEIIKLFNLAVKNGTFNRYALAGGLAVEYYGAPINTVDADFLVLFPETDGGLADASTFFEFFRGQGAVGVGEYLVFHGSNFQMIPANNDLAAEALRTATAVFRKGRSFFRCNLLQHLIALKLRAWRYKDRLHISHLLDSGVTLDNTKLSPILQRYHLEQRWVQLLAEEVRSVLIARSRCGYNHALNPGFQ